MTTTRHHPTPVFSTSDRSEVAAAFATAEAEWFGTGHIVSVHTERSMGTDVGWSVVVFPHNVPETDTSCVNCGCHHGTRCPR